jgi:nitrogen fixation NifU-like protein
MMDMYQQIILEHFKNPRHHFQMPDCDVVLSGDNPLCGDSVRLYLKLDHSRQTLSLSFEGKGCALSQASASIMTETLEGRTVAQAQKYVDEFKYHILSQDSAALPHENQLSELTDEHPLKPLTMVKRFPVRLKCVNLAWDTLEKALLQLQDSKN